LDVERYRSIGAGASIFYDAKNVPQVHAGPYFSKIANAWRQAYVYTPPGYDSSPNTRYPVLYLQHGIKHVYFESTGTAHE
jgi:enterochelin esterase-like enzyme